MNDNERMDMLWKDSKRRIIIVLLVLFLLASLIFNVHQCNRPRYEPSKSDTVRIIEYVEWKDSTPQELQPEKVVGHVSVPHLPRPVKETPDSLHEPEDTLQKADSVYTFPIVQRTFGDSLYTAYVSGPKVDSVGPKLDSISIMQRVETITITNTIIKKRHWHFGIGIGAGYGVFTKKPDIFAGGSVIYEF
ncbi:hypothetical protein SAMN04487900_1109 [Prevotella communis]|uniref:DUF6808 domain-containing protein n=1 Tax=Prevotella communis TaxID=2913614 RepID=A0A1H0GWA9_9BACT|nr:hypothetical protein [Prevotella communis]SDO11165.1 hypothetical protein SAMN04487900_1109 [Prevotella communis]